MTPEETALMAAADRLRRVKDGLNMKDARELYADVYRWRGPDWEVDAIRADRATLADAFLDVWPAEPEPVAIEDTFGKAGFVIHNGKVYPGRWSRIFDCLHAEVAPFEIEETDSPLWETESAARLALRWQKYRDLAGMK